MDMGAYEAQTPKLAVVKTVNNANGKEGDELGFTIKVPIPVTERLTVLWCKILCQQVYLL